MFIDAGFDGGNIEVVSIDDQAKISLNIRTDTNADHAQWFYFRLLGGKNQYCKFIITNAGDASYPEAWPDGSDVASYDGKDWFRILTKFDGTQLTFAHDCQSDTLFVALSPPYPLQRHHELICRALASAHCTLAATIPSVENRGVEVLQIGSHDDASPKVWVIARQHPGEPMAEWFIEGLIDRLTDPLDQTSADLRSKCTFYLVPNMNPDGSIAGNLRTNAAGVDLNRAWVDPSPRTSPEVAGVLSLMDTTGVDLFLDIHGDEEFRFVFAAGCEGIPGFSAQSAQTDLNFREAFHTANPDFSIENGYPPDAPGEADLSIACNQIGDRFGCLSLTIEMPFKENAKRPDPQHGWGTTHSLKTHVGFAAGAPPSVSAKAEGGLEPSSTDAASRSDGSKANKATFKKSGLGCEFFEYGDRV